MVMQQGYIQHKGSPSTWEFSFPSHCGDPGQHVLAVGVYFHWRMLNCLATTLSTQFLAALHTNSTCCLRTEWWDLTVSPTNLLAQRFVETGNGINKYSIYPARGKASPTCASVASVWQDLMTLRNSIIAQMMPPTGTTLDWWIFWQARFKNLHHVPFWIIFFICISIQGSFSDGLRAYSNINTFFILFGLFTRSFDLAAWLSSPVITDLLDACPKPGIDVWYQWMRFVTQLKVDVAKLCSYFFTDALYRANDEKILAFRVMSRFTFMSKELFASTQFLWPCWQ